MILGKKNSIQEYCYIIHWTKYIIKHYLMKCTMIFMCKYSNEMNTTTQQQQNSYITMYNYKLYTKARLEPNKSIKAVQLIY